MDMAKLEVKVIERDGETRLIYPDGRVYLVVPAPEAPRIKEKLEKVDAAQDIYRREMYKKAGIQLDDLPERQFIEDNPAYIFMMTGTKYLRSKYGIVIQV